MAFVRLRVVALRAKLAIAATIDNYNELVK